MGTRESTINLQVTGLSIPDSLTDIKEFAIPGRSGKCTLLWGRRLGMLLQWLGMRLTSMCVGWNFKYIQVHEEYAWYLPEGGSYSKPFFYQQLSGWAKVTPLLHFKPQNESIDILCSTSDSPGSLHIKRGHEWKTLYTRCDQNKVCTKRVKRKR